MELRRANEQLRQQLADAHSDLAAAQRVHVAAGGRGTGRAQRVHVAVGGRGCVWVGTGKGVEARH